MRIKVYIFAFILSFSVTAFVRGLFFLTRYKLGFTDQQNLILALISGFTYIIGAQLSHRCSKYFQPKAVMIFLLAVQCLVPLTCFFHHSFLLLSFLFPLFSLANGTTWPFAESYASAGLDRKQSSYSIGIYNICWSVALPLAVWLSGWIISKFEVGIFIFIAAGVIPAIVLSAIFPSKIPHKEEIDESVPADGEEIENADNLLISSRWSMFLSYALIQLLNSLLPGRFYELGISVSLATFAFGFLDIARTAFFFWMSGTHCWHGNKTILFLSAPILIISFIICMNSNGLLWIIIAASAFGAAAAASYYAALFYAMHTSNAHVGAGGAHESVIGLGFIAGPIIGLIAEKISPLIALNSNHAAILMLGLVSMPNSIISLWKKSKNS